MVRRDITSELQKLLPVTSGMSLRKVWTAERINAVFHLLWALACGDNFHSGDGTRKTSGAAWVQLNTDDDGGLGDGIIGLDPFEVIPSKGDPSAGPWIEVNLNSWLSKSIKPTDKITITGLGAPLQLTASGPKQHIWLEIDLKPLYLDTPGPITAKIAQGKNWNPEGLTIYPDVIVYNTDDGTANGSTGTPPPNTHQITAIVPIAYTVDPMADGFNTALKFGMILISQKDGSGGVSLMQQLRNNLKLSQGCYDADPNVYYVEHWHAPMPDDSGG